MSGELWEKFSYKKNEKDRVVLHVSLKASKDNTIIFDQSYLLDASADDNSTAMARLVSIPVAIAVGAILENKIPVGVNAAPKSSDLVSKWLDQIKNEAQIFNLIKKA